MYLQEHAGLTHPAIQPKATVYSGISNTPPIHGFVARHGVMLMIIAASKDIAHQVIVVNAQKGKIATLFWQTATMWK